MTSNNTATTNANSTESISADEVYKFIKSLTSLDSRELALYELCRQREVFPELAVLIWNSCGAVAGLLQEIVAVYPYMSPPTVNAHQSNRVCNALALLQCLATHSETRSEFLRAGIPNYLYTFLSNTCPEKPFEYLRLTSLGVIGALVKTDEQEVIEFLLNSEFIPLCLVIMELGSDLCKKVATFIMQKLLTSDMGLSYICQTYERFFHVSTVLNKVVTQLARDKSITLLRYVVICYLRLTEDRRALDALRNCLPTPLLDGTFSDLLEQDVAAKRHLAQLIHIIRFNPENPSTTNSTSTTATTTRHNSNPSDNGGPVSSSSTTSTRSASVTTTSVAKADQQNDGNRRITPDCSLANDKQARLGNSSGWN